MLSCDAVFPFQSNFMCFKISSINVSLSAMQIIGQMYVTYKTKQMMQMYLYGLKTHAVDIFDVINLVFACATIRGQEHS